MPTIIYRSFAFAASTFDCFCSGYPWPTLHACIFLIPSTPSERAWCFHSNSNTSYTVVTIALFIPLQKKSTRPDLALGFSWPLLLPVTRRHPSENQTKHVHHSQPARRKPLVVPEGVQRTVRCGVRARRGRQGKCDGAQRERSQG